MITIIQLRHSFACAFLFALSSYAQCYEGIPAGYTINSRITAHVVDPECSFDNRWRKHLADPSIEGIRIIYATPKSSTVLPLAKVNPANGDALSVWSLDGKLSSSGTVTNASDVGGDFSAFVVSVSEDNCRSVRIGSAVTLAASRDIAGFVRKVLTGPKCTLHVIKPDSIRSLLSMEPPPDAAPSQMSDISSEFPLRLLESNSQKPGSSIADRSGLGGGKAKVFVYRYNQFTGKALRPSLLVDGRDVARIQSGRYIVLELDPGKRTFTSSDRQAEVELDLAAGANYYLRVDIAPGVFKGHGRLILVMAEQGAAEIKKVTPADGDVIKDRSLLWPGFEPRN